MCSSLRRRRTKESGSHAAALPYAVSGARWTRSRQQLQRGGSAWPVCHRRRLQHAVSPDSEYSNRSVRWFDCCSYTAAAALVAAHQSRDATRANCRSIDAVVRQFPVRLPSHANSRGRLPRRRRTQRKRPASVSPLTLSRSRSCRIRRVSRAPGIRLGGSLPTDVPSGM